MNRLLKLGAVLLAAAASLWPQTTINGDRIDVGSGNYALAPHFTPKLYYGTPTSSDCNNSATITSSTNASPIVITHASHGLTNGTIVRVYQHATNTNANGIWMVGSVTTNTFALCGYWDGTVCQSPSTGNGVGGATGFYSTQVGHTAARIDPAAATQSLYTCEDVAGGSPGWSLQGGANTRTTAVTDLSPVSGDSGLILVINPVAAIHLTRIFCAVQGSTNVVVNLDKRTEAAIGTDTGNHLLGADLTAVSGGANTSTFANGAGQCGATTSCAIAAHAPVVMTFTSVSGTPTALDCSVDYTVDAP